MGAQSSVFGPVKYSILPQHLRVSELTGGNGMVGLGTFLAILLATSAISRELEAGTLELLLAQPVSRDRVLLSKFLFNAGNTDRQRGLHGLLVLPMYFAAATPGQKFRVAIYIIDNSVHELCRIRHKRTA